MAGDPSTTRFNTETATIVDRMICGGFYSFPICVVAALTKMCPIIPANGWSFPIYETSWNHNRVKWLHVNVCPLTQYRNNKNDIALFRTCVVVSPLCQYIEIYCFSYFQPKKLWDSLLARKKERNPQPPATISTIWTLVEITFCVFPFPSPDSLCVHKWIRIRNSSVSMVSHVVSQVLMLMPYIDVWNVNKSMAAMRTNQFRSN